MFHDALVPFAERRIIIMEFTTFMELVRIEAEKRVCDDCSVQLVTTTKNNGVVLNGITILQDGCNISPTIYLDDHYDAYQNGTATIGMITDTVMDTYEKNKTDRSIDMGGFLNYASAKEQIVYKLVNTEKNRELLENIPHVPFHDLSIVFEYFVSQGDKGSISILIRNEYMNAWNADTEELYRTASINTPLLRKYELKSMGEVLCELEDKMDFGDPCGISPMYVLQNESKVMGAACILYPNLLSDFAAACKSDLFIIPSSIHETLILPYADPSESEEIKKMIRDINRTQVAAEEVLSDNLYIYEKSTNELRMV